MGKLCKPSEEGGIGIRKLEDMEKSLYILLDQFFYELITFLEGLKTIDEIVYKEI